jgi:hypothetical protein
LKKLVRRRSSPCNVFTVTNAVHDVVVHSSLTGEGLQTVIAPPFGIHYRRILLARLPSNMVVVAGQGRERGMARRTAQTRARRWATLWFWSWVLMRLFLL